MQPKSQLTKKQTKLNCASVKQPELMSQWLVYGGNKFHWRQTACLNTWQFEGADFSCIVYIPFLPQQDGQVEATEEQPKKSKLFFIHAVETWDAEFYAKVNDDVYVNIGMQSSVASL